MAENIMITDPDEFIRVYHSTTVADIPQLTEEWPEVYSRKMKSVRRNSPLNMQWKCRNCGNTYRYKVRYRYPGDMHCPECRKNAFCREVELIEEYIISRVYRCTVCGNTFHVYMSKGNYEVPFCHTCYSGFPVKGVNTLADLSPELAEEFSERNGINPSEISRFSTTPYIWICRECGQSYVRTPDDRYPGDRLCPCCMHEKAYPGVNTIDVMAPELLKKIYGTYDRPENIPRFSERYIVWKCDECGEGFYWAPLYIKTSQVLCHKCRRKEEIRRKSLAVQFPELLEAWDYQYNALLEMPDQVLPSSKVRYWWYCEECGQRYLQSPSERLERISRKQSLCTFCTGNRRQLARFI